MIRRSGRYYLLVIAVRDLENPRESILAEVYFNSAQPLVFPLSLIRQQAEAAKILVEEFDAWTVELPTLAELLQALSGATTTIDDFISKLGPVEQWTMKSIRRFVDGPPDKPEKQVTEPSGEWIEMYRRGESEAAVTALSERLAQDPKRPAAARIYNDRGYILYDMPDRTGASIRDLERVLALHHRTLALTLINIAVAEIDRNEFAKAIQHLNDALLITHELESVGASYLRIRLLGSHLLFARREKWEQHPANVIEAAYINLAYALTKLKGHDASLEVLQEGLELLPSSVRLKHALARWHLSQRRAVLADPLYDELAKLSVDDPDLRREIEAYRTVGRKGRRFGFRRQPSTFSSYTQPGWKGSAARLSNRPGYQWFQELSQPRDVAVIHDMRPMLKIERDVRRLLR